MPFGLALICRIVFKKIVKLKKMKLGKVSVNTIDRLNVFLTILGHFSKKNVACKKIKNDCN